MTYQEANHISIKDYLKSLGILPAVDKYYYGMYHSPFRQDGTPSFKVDYGVNLEAKRQHLLTCLQDHVENVMWSRMERETASDQQPAPAAEEERREAAPVRSIGRDRRVHARRSAEQTEASFHRNGPLWRLWILP